MSQPACLEKMTSVRGRGQLVQKGQAFKAPIVLLSSNKSDDRDHKDPLGLNKPRPSKTPTGHKAPAGPKTSARPKAPPGPP